MPSSRSAKRLLVHAVPEQRETIYELGSGWGGLAFLFAKTYPYSQVYALERSFFPWLVSFVLQKIFRYPNLKIVKRDFFDLSLEEAEVVVCYLYPGAMQRLKEKFERELKGGAHILSNSFSIQGWVPLRVLRAEDLLKSEIIIYNLGMNKKNKN